MKISLIISTYNAPDYLKLVLRSIAKQILPSNCTLEVLIADDGSGLETKSLIAKYQEKFRFKLLHIWHTDVGFRKAIILNRAVAASSGEYLLFVDGDCVLDKKFVANHLQLSEIDYFIAGNRILLSERFTQKIIRSEVDLQRISVIKWLFYASSKKSNNFLHWLRFGFNARWRKSRQTNWRYPKGCNIGMWKTDYLMINGYDESFVGWGHEDADLFIRLIHAGIKIKDGRFAAPVYHLWHKINDRSNEAENMARLMTRVNNQDFVRAEDGIDKYLTDGV